MDSRKPLTAGEIEEIETLVGNHYATWESDDKEAAATYLARLLSLLTPPPDAALREAVDAETVSKVMEIAACFGAHEDDVRIFGNVRAGEGRDALLRLLNSRAVQAPRLTGEQVEAVKGVYKMAKDWVEELGECDHDVDVCYCGERRELEFFRAAFPEAFAGEVGCEGL